jgi:uncharacterized protein YacL
MEVTSMLGQLSDNEFLNNLDNFFLVFISAWMGSNTGDWPKNGILFILFILSVLIYALILATARDSVSNYKKRNYKDVISEIVGLLFVLILFSAYLLAKGFIKADDMYVYCHIGVVWAMLTILPPLLSKIKPSDN